MNRGLIAKTLREVWFSTLLIALGMAVLETLFAYVVPTFFGEFSKQFLGMRFFQRMLTGLLGTEVGVDLGLDSVMSVAWVHPIALALIWTQGIVSCTRVPAGEVDRGTIDVLLGLPASRTRVYLCETVVWLGSGLVVVAAGLAGHLVGSWLGPLGSTTIPLRTMVTILNLYCLYVAVAGMACLVSSLSDRRGRAVAVVFGIVLASFFLNFLAQFWQPAKAVSFLSVLNYHRPLMVLREGAGWSVRDLVVLASVGTVLWAGGGVVFARRDVRTV